MLLAQVVFELCYGNLVGKMIQRKGRLMACFNMDLFPNPARCITVCVLTQKSKKDLVAGRKDSKLPFATGTAHIYEDGVVPMDRGGALAVLCHFSIMLSLHLVSDSPPAVG